MFIKLKTAAKPQSSQRSEDKTRGHRVFFLFHLLGDYLFSEKRGLFSVNSVVNAFFRTKYAALIMATMACLAFLATSAAAEPLCKESLGEYYVNIGIANTGFGTGLDDAFEVVIRRMRPSSEEDLERLKAFNYFEGKDEKGEAYSDGRQYLWQKEGKQYRLFRKVGGRKDVRIDLFVVTFTPANKMKNMMRLMNANRTVYNELGLQSKLQVLGVMGVAFRGRQGNVEFINNLKADPGPDAAARVYVSNADTMLSRYARTAGYEMTAGTAGQITDTDWNGEPALHNLLSKGDEQYVLDNISPFVERQGYAKEMDDLVGTFGDIKVNGLKRSDIKYIFMKCVPNGVSTYGSPRAAFVPLKVIDGTTSYYPVFVFPSAFSSTDALNFEIWKTGVEVRWWNGAANLDVNIAEQKRLREALLRYDVPHLMLDYFKSPLSKQKTAEFVVHFSVSSLFKTSLDTAVNKPDGPRAIPWTVSPNLVMAEPPGSMMNKTAETKYNKFFADRVPDLRWYMKEKEGLAGAKEKAKSAVKFKAKEKAVKKLVEAISEGYAITKEERTKALTSALDASALYFEYLKSWKDIPEAERSGALELINKIKKVTNPATPIALYAFDDLEWLNELVQNYPLPAKSLKNEIVGKRMEYLVNTEKVRGFNNLDKVLSDPHMFLQHRDEKAIADSVDVTLKRGEDAITNHLEKKTDKEVKDRLKKKEAIEAVKQELKILKESLAGAFQEKTDAETAAKNAVSPKESAYSASYDEMSAACKGGSFSPSRTGTDDSLYRDIYNAYLFNDEKLIACTPKANAFVKARQEYRDTIEEQDRNVSVKAKPVHELDDQADDLFEKMALLVQLKDDAGIPGDGLFKRTMNKALIGVGIKKPVEGAKSWKEVIKRAFEQYLTGGGSEKEAYKILDTHLKKVPGLEIVKGGQP